MNARSRPGTELTPAEKEAAVLPLAKRGLSAKQIALQLNVATRNSIITVMGRLKKRHRLGDVRTVPEAKSQWAAMTAEQKQAAVKAGRAAGKTFSAIETQYGAPHGSAGSVARVLRRYGDLPEPPAKPNKPAQPNRPTKKRPPSKPSARTAVGSNWHGRSTVHPNDFKGRAEQRDTSPGIEVISSAAAWDPLEGHQPITLMQLTERTCRWPVEPDSDQQGTFFCGAPCDLETPYCPSHAALSRGRQTAPRIGVPANA
ncbi:GcrA family cell cycle regulator [Mesorhizobium sp. Z1-4]|uniref:GcrA family cell cycle regulator n=1 Tax=Mesorhizobium sp. Z1-4 TaxID=2448478 RepID=UPI000FD87C63|nr:GcrA family cell cycle regulator [Mesorhizobium sp. Z1-4]